MQNPLQDVVLVQIYSGSRNVRVNASTNSRLFPPTPDPSTTMEPRSSKHHYAPEKRARIALAYESGMSKKEISVKEDVPVRSINGIVARYRVQKHGQSLPRCGRPPALAERDKRRIARVLTIGPFVTVAELKREAGLACCLTTLASFLEKGRIQRLEAIQKSEQQQLVEGNAPPIAPSV
ncbi:DNA transposase [Colletotrichum truncatum]|uniref:DNA transposase n=1 Tax=Colletotrichum truncatum TaxID=5467 RepID=A0ACC3YPT4_COLTU|nr:DNA transposase [Colletotrichum truncatum]KAF6796812.1 DNA transposase [Colletotrichum truncatum]